MGRAIAKLPALVSSLAFVIEFINTKNRIFKQQQLGAKKTAFKVQPNAFLYRFVRVFHATYIVERLLLLRSLQF